MYLLTWYLLTPTLTEVSVDSNLIASLGVALITFVLAPVILFFLGWFKDSIGSAKKKQEALTATIATAVEHRVSELIKDEVHQSLTSFKEGIKEDIHEIKSDVRRIEDVILGRRRD